MAKQVLFVHGGGGGAYKADAELAESLRAALGTAYHVRYPEMPDEEEPEYEIWKRIILQEAGVMGASAILVGHSIGASVLAKVLTENGAKPSIAGAFLVSGPFWYDHDFWRWDEVALSADANDRFPPKAALYLYHGVDDEFVPVAHLEMYAEVFPQAIVRRLGGRNHQLNEDMSDVARDILTLA